MNYIRCALLLGIVLLSRPLPVEGTRPAGSRQPVDAFKTRISHQEASEDLEVMRSILIEMHPGLNLYATQQELDALIEKAQVAKGETVALRSFFMSCARIADRVRCGHTYANIPLSCQFKLEYATRMFPVSIMFIDQRAYVNHHKSEIPCGAEILSINGIEMDAIEKELMPLVTGDGYVDTFRYRFLGELFSISFATAYGEKKEFQVRYTTLGGETKEKRISAISSAALSQRSDHLALGGLDDSTYRISRPRKDTVLLAIDSFDNGDTAPSFRVFRKLIDKAFLSMHGSEEVKNLILDLRQNDGGYTRSEMFLYSYLATRPFKEMASGQATRNSIAFPELLSRQYQSRAAARYYDRRLQKEMVDGEGEQLELLSEWIVRGVPSEHRFKGKVFVLTGGRTHSAGSAICTRLKERGNVIFVGEETGGVEGVFTAGTTLIYELPNTGIELAVPILKYNNLRKMPAQPGRGIIPDHHVSIQPEDLISGKDRVLEFTLELIGKADSP